MAAGDLTAWRRQNSDPVTVDMVMTDGSELRAIVLVPRDKNLKDVFNVDEAFIEVECLENGNMVFARTAMRSVRATALPRADQLERRTAAMEKLGCHAALGMGRAATIDAVTQAHARLVRNYDPQHLTVEGLPPEVLAYMRAMRARLDAAYAEIAAIHELAQKPAA